MSTGFLYDSRFLDHDAGSHHPERMERLQASIDHLECQDWFSMLTKFTGKPAEHRWIETIHSNTYITRAMAACSSGARYLDVVDVGICAESFDIALLAAGGFITLADEVSEGRLSNAFMLSRPPGHHAERDLALGFCLLNNVAIAARYLQKQHGVEKILILDWDVHHGNGTQHSFEADPSVMYISTHQYPFYPGTGSASENGIGAGVGATLNCPMPAGATDDDYERAFLDRILPAAHSFAPQFIIISAGFDAHRDDPLAHINLSTEFFGWMTERVMEVADQHAGGRIISVLEGGYNIQKLPICVAEHLRVLAGPSNNHKSVPGHSPGDHR